MRITEFEVGDIIENEYLICEVISNIRSVVKIIDNVKFSIAYADRPGTERSINPKDNTWKLVKRAKKKEGYMRVSQCKNGDIVSYDKTTVKVIDGPALKVQFLIRYGQLCENNIKTETLIHDDDVWIMVKRSQIEGENSMFKNVKSQIDMNKEIAIQESEKQLGKIILDQVKESDLFKELPGFI